MYKYMGVHLSEALLMESGWRFHNISVGTLVGAGYLDGWRSTERSNLCRDIYSVSQTQRVNMRVRSGGDRSRGNLERDNRGPC